VLAVALPLLTAAAAAGAQEGGTGWPMAGGDAAHQGVVGGPDPPYAVAWEAEVPGGLADGPVVAADVVVAVGRDRVVALDAASGELVWEAERRSGPAGSPALAGGVVVHASGEGSQAAVVARSMDDGRERWRFFTGSTIQAGPLIVDDRVYAATTEGLVVAVGLGDGEAAWERRIEASIEAPLALSDGLLLASVQQTAGATGLVTTLLVALDPDSGEEEWRFATDPGAPGATAVSVAGGVAFFGAGDGQVHAVDLETGSGAWASRTESGFSLPPPLFSGFQVPAAPGDPIVADLAHVQRFDAATGDDLWSFRLTDGLFRSGVTVVGGYALVGEQFSSRVSAIDVESGRRVWRSEDLGEGAATSVAGDADRLYVGLLGAARREAAATPTGAATGEPAPSRAGRIVALEHDPSASLVSEASDSTLVLGRALLNFAVAAVAVAATLVALFRYGFRPRQPADAPERP
jgi:outer membrane protein assembly factor BamB